MSRDNPATRLFSDYDLRGTLENIGGRAENAVEQYSADRLLAQSEDDLVSQLVEEFRVTPPALTEGAMSVDVEEAQVDVGGRFDYDTEGEGRYYVPGMQVNYYVPFLGDPRLLQCRPGTFTLNPPRAHIGAQELRFSYDRTDNDVAATKREFDSELGNVRQWLGWTANEVTMFNDMLPRKLRAKVAERRERLKRQNEGLAALGLPVRRPSRTEAPPPQPPARAAAKPAAEDKRVYDVACSFAGENRPYVHRVAELLRKVGIDVFYDEFEKARLWGKNLIDYLADIYQHRSRFVVMFISKHYVEKAFPTHERQQAQARALVVKDEYILPARFDDTDVPGMASTVAYVDLRNTSPEKLAELILEKIGRKS